MMAAPRVPKVLIYLQPPLLNRFMVANWESTQLLHRRLSSSDLRVYLTTHWFRSCSRVLVMFFIRVIEKKEKAPSHRVTESQSRALKYMNAPDAWQRPSVVGVCWVAVTMLLQRIGGVQPRPRQPTYPSSRAGWIFSIWASFRPWLSVQSLDRIPKSVTPPGCHDLCSWWLKSHITWFFFFFFF